MKRIMIPRLTLDEVCELGRAAASINAAAMMIGGSNWNGKAPALTALQQALQVIARIYNRAEPAYLQSQLSKDRGARHEGYENYKPEGEPILPPRKAHPDAEA
jgi:hypothetical protein